MSDGLASEDPNEALLADAVQELEQCGDAGLQVFLNAHPTEAGSLRAGLERLRRMGVLSAPPTAPPDRLQYGEFRIVRRLATGGMGIVYLAVQTSLQRQVALKVVRPEFLLSATARERFQREVEAVARLHHPGIVPIVAVGTEGSQPWFVMEFIAGHTLEELLESMVGKDPARAPGSALRTKFAATATKLPGVAGAFADSYWETCVRLVHQVAVAMTHVHERGIVHRDLKPSNILVTGQGQALVVDFGLAHVQDLQRLTRLEAQMGSPAYMAPEQIRGEAIDERVDVYGLAVTLYQLLTTRLPFAGDTPQALQDAILAGALRPLRTFNRAVPRDLEVACAVALDRDRARRYRTMADFAADLERVLGKRPVLARPLGLGLRLVRRAQRHPAWAIGIAAVVVVALQFPLVLWWLQAGTNAELRRVNDELTAQRSEANANYDDALTAIQEMVVRTGNRDLATVPGSEPVRLAILERADRLYERLRSRRAGDRRIEVDAARNLQHLGGLQDSVGQDAAAEARLRAASERLAPFAGADVWHLRGTILRLLGSLLRSHGRLDESEASLVQARCDLESALAVEPHDRAMLRQFAEATASLALVQGQRGHAEQQMELLLVAQAIKDRLVAEHPNDLGGVIAHALGCNAIAAAHHVAGRRDEALQWTERGITMLLRTRPEGPEAQTWRWRLALLLETRGNANLQLGRIDAAEQDHGESLALRLELLADAPSTASRVDYVSASWHNLSLIHRARQNFAAALECSLESIAHARQAVRMDPQNRQYREHFENSLSARCGYLLSLQRDADLPAAIDDLIAGASSPGAMLGAARFALRLARRLEVAAIAEDADVARWRARAMGQIETAVAAGFTDAAHFATGQWARHYDDLRADPGFAALLANLAARK